jgi:hypothetical protein
MKSKSSFFLFLSFVAGLFATVTTCAARGPGACGAGCADDAIREDQTAVVLSEQARSALLFQIDEERMARELYLAFGERWNLRPFRNIVQAETRHEAVLRALAKRAGLSLPETVAGRFTTAAVQERYDTLLARGRQSAEEALRTGALVEEQDIADLRALAKSTDNAELRQVVAALERASGHHLAAFVRNMGNSYTAQVLPAADVIALTDKADGGKSSAGRSGRGAGWRGGRAD